MSSLAARAERIEAGDYDVTFGTARSDEFGDLNRTLAATRDTLRRWFTELTETTNALEASNAAFDVAGVRLHSNVNSWPIGAFPGPGSHVRPSSHEREPWSRLTRLVYMGCQRPRPEIELLLRVDFDDGTLLLRDVPDGVPYAEWDDRVDKYRTQVYRYRALLEWAGAWRDGDEQTPLSTP